VESDTNEPTQDAASGTGAFNQDDVDTLLRGDAAEPTTAGASESAPSSAKQDDDVSFSQTDLDALMQAAGGDASQVNPVPSAPNGEESPDPGEDALGRAFDEQTAAIQAAIEEEQVAAAAARAASAPRSAPAPPTAPPQTTPFEFPDLGEPGKYGIDPKRVSMLNDVKLRVKIELGRTRMLVEEVLKLDEGSVVELDKLAGDPVDVFVNDRLVARGEVLVLNDSFCVRVSEVLSHDPHRVST